MTEEYIASTSYNILHPRSKTVQRLEGIILDNVSGDSDISNGSYIVPPESMESENMEIESVKYTQHKTPMCEMKELHDSVMAMHQARLKLIEKSGFLDADHIKAQLYKEWVDDLNEENMELVKAMKVLDGAARHISCHYMQKLLTEESKGVKLEEKIQRLESACEVFKLEMQGKDRHIFTLDKKVADLFAEIKEKSSLQNTVHDVSGNGDTPYALQPRLVETINEQESDNLTTESQSNLQDLQNLVHMLNAEYDGSQIKKQTIADTKAIEKTQEITEKLNKLQSHVIKLETDYNRSEVKLLQAKEELIESEKLRENHQIEVDVRDQTISSLNTKLKVAYEERNKAWEESVILKNQVREKMMELDDAKSVYSKMKEEACSPRKVDAFRTQVQELHHIVKDYKKSLQESQMNVTEKKEKVISLKKEYELQKQKIIPPKSSVKSSMQSLPTSLAKQTFHAVTPGSKLPTSKNYKRVSINCSDTVTSNELESHTSVNAETAIANSSAEPDKVFPHKSAKFYYK